MAFKKKGLSRNFPKGSLVPCHLESASLRPCNHLSSSRFALVCLVVPCSVVLKHPVRTCPAV
eukprot:373309-Prorocentrum_minimum.AAC.2